MEYFNEVDRNAVLRAAHQSDPHASMQIFGLNATEQQAVLSGSNEALADAMCLESIEIPTLHTPNSVFLSEEETVYTVH